VQSAKRPSSPIGSDVGTTLSTVLADLTDEGDELDAIVAELDQRSWCLATPAAGWDIATSVAHLAWTDTCAIAAIADPPAWGHYARRAVADPEGFVDREARIGARASSGEIYSRWRQTRRQLAVLLGVAPTDAKLPWFGPPMSATSMATARLMETWAHGLDICDALGNPLKATDRLRHIAHLSIRTRDFSFRLHDLEPPNRPVRIDLLAPSGARWSWGPDDAAEHIEGTALDFCLLATQRRHRDDLNLVATGSSADRWLDIAQAFAGPPGTGRKAASNAT
jgi:uncharacterized protein (TIGR03084 family)